jgi:enoyl reductase-like protein
VKAFPLQALVFLVKKNLLLRLQSTATAFSITTKSYFTATLEHPPNVPFLPFADKRVKFFFPPDTLWNVIDVKHFPCAVKTRLIHTSINKKM